MTSVRPKRTETILIRLSKQEKETLLSLAAKADMSASDYFRRVMLPAMIGGKQNVSE